MGAEVKSNGELNRKGNYSAKSFRKLEKRLDRVFEKKEWISAFCGGYEYFINQRR
jgi:hypothetical protein